MENKELDKIFVNFQAGKGILFEHNAVRELLLGNINPEALVRLQNGMHHDPHSFLGLHALSDEYSVIRCFMPSAQSVAVESEHAELSIEMQRLPNSDLFVAIIDAAQKAQLAHYKLHWLEADGLRHTMVSPYSFMPTIGEIDLHLIAEGRHWNAYDVLGANVIEVDGVSGVRFTVWAPAAERVSVVGDFNAWHGLRHPMRSIGSTGIWELFVPGLHSGDVYKFEIRNRQSGHVFLKTDPYAKSMEMRPANGSKVFETHYQWQDADWMQERQESEWSQKPMSIYEVHLGSWQQTDEGGFLPYKELAKRLIDYVVWMGFTHIELLPVAEHPLDQSWGYQVTGYFAPTSRFGSPDDFRYFVDYAHQNGIGVILDWVPAHFPKDSFALGRFDGSALYEHEDPRQGEHQDWGTYIFNFGRNEVCGFLISNALYWLKEFHIDGLRVDAVASMLYLDYSREGDNWVPNKYGGRENLEAIQFLQTLNYEVHDQCPGTVVIAEESTAWPMVSRPTWMGGLGFSMKWNMGWMNDTLNYMEQNPVYRSYHHNSLTFSQMYAFTENFVLPLSHDEVVHMKKSLIDKMPGDDWQKAANLRLLLAYQMLHPGKKLLFMGGEFGQWREWSESRSLDWYLSDNPLNRGIMLMQRQLNHMYSGLPELHQKDFDGNGFEWIDCHDYSQSVISFQRKSDDGFVVVVMNNTPVVRERYRLGVPLSGNYECIFNSDAHEYFGSGVGESLIATQEIEWMGHSQSIEMTLPPLSAIVFKPQTQR